MRESEIKAKGKTSLLQSDKNISNFKKATFTLSRLLTTPTKLYNWQDRQISQLKKVYYLCHTFKDSPLAVIIWSLIELKATARISVLWPGNCS